MSHRIVHQATAFGLAAFFTIGILTSINLLAALPAEQAVMAAESAASHVAQTTPASPARNSGG